MISAHRWRSAGLWSLAGATALVGHGAVTYGVVAMMPPQSPPRAVEQALTVELTPLSISTAEPVATETVHEVQPEKTVEPALVEAVDTVEEPETREEATVEAKPESVEEVETAEVTPVEEIEEVETPVKKAEVVLPKPKKKPAERRTESEKKLVKPEPEKKKEFKKPAKKDAAAETPSRASKPKAPTVNPSRWHRQVQAAVNRRKPRSNGSSGQVRVRFLVSSSGALVSAAIARSSGNSSLDAAALKMVHGARFPPAPAGLGGSNHPFTLPVTFE